MQQLFEKNAKVESADDSGQTPLFYAAKGNSDEGPVRLLLSWGADMVKKDGKDQTPLFYARENGNEAVVKLLESHAAAACTA